MHIDGHKLLGVAAIKNLKYSGEIREDSYKKAVLHSYNAAVHLYLDGYYPAAIQNAHWCADMAVKLFLWKKHLVNYTDYHNLPMVRILNWMPQQEEMKHVIENLRELHKLYEQFGDYMEMVEEYPEHLFGSEKKDLFQEEGKDITRIKEGAKNAILLLDISLLILLAFE
jgi:hypothetical protein